MARAIAGPRDGKAPGGDGIPAEVWQHGGDNLFSRLYQQFTNAWEVGSVPQAWKDASIVTICGNYRGISLLSIAGKIFARILLNSLSTYITPEVVPETQCGFRVNRNTMDMIFCLRQLQEKCIEQDRPLYMVFVDCIHREVRPDHTSCETSDTSRWRHCLSVRVRQQPFKPFHHSTCL